MQQDAEECWGAILISLRDKLKVHRGLGSSRSRPRAERRQAERQVGCVDLACWLV